MGQVQRMPNGFILMAEVLAGEVVVTIFDGC